MGTRRRKRGGEGGAVGRYGLGGHLEAGGDLADEGALIGGRTRAVVAVHTRRMPEAVEAVRCPRAASLAASAGAEAVVALMSECC